LTNKRIEQLQLRVLELEETLSALQEASRLNTDRLQAQVTNSADETDRLKRDNTALQASALALQASTLLLEENITNGCLEIMSLETQLATKFATLTDLHTLLAGRDLEIGRLEGEVSAVADVVKNLERSIADDKGDIKRLECELLEKQVSVDELRVDLEEARRETGVCGEDISRLTLELSHIVGERSIEARDIIGRLEGDVTEGLNTIARLEEVATARQTSVTQLEQEITVLKSLTQQGDKAQMRLEREVSDGSELIVSLRTELSLLRSSLLDSESELSIARDTIKKLQVTREFYISLFC